MNPPTKLMELLFGKARYSAADEAAYFLRTVEKHGVGEVAIIPAAETYPFTRRQALYSSPSIQR